MSTTFGIAPIDRVVIDGYSDQVIWPSPKPDKGDVGPDNWLKPCKDDWKGI